MLGLSLGLGLSQRGGDVWTPAVLFAQGEPGGWYDPSDLSTMFQDSAGTTPVTATGQTVGLVLDKSQGLALGPELVTNGDFASATGWTLGTGWSIGGGVAAFNGGGGVSILQNVGLAAGKTYEITLTVATISSGAFRILCGFDTASPNMISAGTYTFRLIRGTNSFIYVQSQGTTVGSIDNISVRELPGNHLTQSTLSNRAIYGVEPVGGRRNLLTYTEQFDNAAWTKNASSVTANSSTAPDGTTTADTITDTVANDVHVAFQSVSVASATTYTFSAYVKAGTLNHAMLRIGGNSFGIPSPSVKATLTGSGSVTVLEGSVTNPTIVAVGGGWYRVSFTSTTVSSVFTAPQVGPHNNGATSIYTGSGTGTVLAWGAQLEVGSTATAYQAVTDQWNVTQAGVPSVPYVQFDGSDDFYISPTITPGIDKAQVFAGVRKLSDAATGTAVELSTSGANGSIGMFAPLGAVANYEWRSRGTALAQATSGNTFAAPITNVLTGIGDIAADTAILRINGTQVGSSTADQGTGNYLAYPLYIGRRGGTTLPFNGRIYSLIVRFGANLDTPTIQQTEAWVNSKTGAY